MKPYMISELLRLGAIKLVYFTPLLEDSKCRRVTNAFQFLVHVVDLGKHILVLRILHACIRGHHRSALASLMKQSDLSQQTYSI